MFKLRNKFSPNSRQWKEILTITRIKKVTVGEKSCFETKQLCEKVDKIMEYIKNNDVNKVIEELEENNSKRQKLKKNFVNELKIA